MKIHLPKILTAILLTILTCLLSAISIARFNQGQLFYYDFGIFAHIIFQLSRFQVPIINHLALGHIIFLGDHFNPGLVIFAPLFWLTGDLRIILVEQAAVVVLSAFVIYKIGIKWQLNRLLSLSSAFAYLIFAGTLNPLVTDWHPESTAALFLLIFFYFFNFTKRTYLYLTFILLFLSLKESNAISMIFLLSWLFILKKDLQKKIMILIIFSTLYFLFTTRIIIPAFSQKPYIYTPEISYNPLKIAQNITNTQDKQKLILQSFQSFGFIPLLSGFGLLLPISELAIRLAPDKTIFNNISLGQHYNVILGIFLALTTTKGFLFLQEKSLNSKNIILKKSHILFAIFLIISSLYTARKITGSPINVLSNPVFYSQFGGDEVLKDVLKNIPKKGTVMAQNNILAYLSNRTENIYLLNRNYQSTNPDIIVFDLRDGQSINNYYGTTLSEIKDLPDILQKDLNYQRQKYTPHDIYVYTKNK